MSVLDEQSAKRTYLPANARRAQILSCARAVFATRGFHVASVADICSAAGIGRGTLYQYFSNKREVLEAVLEELFERVKGELATRPAVSQLDGVEVAPPALITAFCANRLRRMLDVVFVDEASLRLLLRWARGLDGGIDTILARIDDLVLGALVADLEAARRMGVIECPEPELAARFVLGGVEKLVLTALASDAPVDLGRIVSVATDIHLSGLLSERTRAVGRRT
ncbi:MAG: TetR/AcrR family transcriptional regulator [Myxococcales bacterium]|nr:TetR/AcrR family transcriptional regulator [Myxococcales bacterium]